MSGSGQKKSLTEPPQNLKEAIDWVLRVSGRDSNNDGKQAIEGLAGTIQAMLNGDPGDLREEVQEMFGEVRNGVIQKLMSNKPSEPEWGFTVPIAHLNDISGSLITAVKDAPRLVRDVDEISKWLKQDIDSHNGPISDLAGKLKTLLGCNGYNKFDGSGLIQNGNSYKSAYPESLRWPTEPSDQKTCALIFLSCCRLIYYGLTYLYWQCESKDGNWKDQQFQKSGPTNSLSAYLDAMDYSETMFDQGKKNGSHIATVLQSAFPELTKHATNRYPSYLRKILNEAVSSTDSPLSRCYLISHHCITYPLYTVHSPSPATPSFAGYSGLTALAGGAYGFNLGGLGSFISALLA